MSKAPYIVGWVGSLALAFVIGLFVGRGSGTETAAPAINENLVTRARAPNENELIAANAERPEAPAPPAQPAQPTSPPAPAVQEASSTLPREPVDDFEAVEEAVEQMDDGSKPPR